MTSRIWTNLRQCHSLNAKPGGQMTWRTSTYLTRRPEFDLKQEIWANAHRTRDSISLISYAGFLVYLQHISAKIHCTCASQPKIAINSLKTHIFGVQCRSRSSMLVPLESSSAVLVMISSKSVSLCSSFHPRWANSGKITISEGGTPIWCPRSRGISSPSCTKLPRKKLETRLSYSEDPESVSHLALNSYRVVTDRRTDGRTDG